MTAAPESVATIVVGGVEVTPRFTTNGLVAVEDTFDGKSIEAVGQAMKAGGASYSAVRSIFRAALLGDIPDMTEVGAGRVLGDIGLEAGAAVIQTAFESLQAGEYAKPVDMPEPDVQGRLAFEVGGTRYVLVFGFNAMAEIEPMFPGMGMPQIAQALLTEGVSLSRVRALFRAALIDHREVSLYEAGEIIDRIGIANASNAVGKSFVGAFPKVPGNDGDQEGGNRKSRRAAAVTGVDPTKRRRRKAGTGKP